MSTLSLFISRLIKKTDPLYLGQSVMVFVGILGVLGLIFALYSFTCRERILLSMSRDLEQLKEKAIIVSKLNDKKHGYKKKYESAISEYLKQDVEPLVFLSKEVAFLSKVENLPGFTQFGPVKNRVKHLTSKDNKLQFEEKKKDTKYGFTEKIFFSSHPVDVDLNDLEVLLSKIEGVEIKDLTPSVQRPQLFVKRLYMKRKPNLDQNESFQLDIELLQREILQ